MTKPELSPMNFQPPGPVAASWVADTETPFPLIMGPIESGKTTSAIFKGTWFSTRMMPPGQDGVIRVKGTVIRDQYRPLYRTTLQSWFKWFPKDYPGSKFTGGDDRPAQHHIRYQLPKGIILDMVVDFYAVAGHRLEELLRGYETTWSWLNEADLLTEDVPGYMYGRCGRYPSPGQLGPEHQRKLAAGEWAMPKQVFGDLNPPDIEHWIYKRCVENREIWPGYKLYRQPGGRTGKHENSRFVPAIKYQQMADANNGDPLYIRRMIDAEFGYSRDGEPVYSEFSEALHVADKPLEPVSGLPVIIGLDGGQGLHPAATLHQAMPDGQWRTLDEVSLGRVGSDRFIEALLTLLEAKYAHCDTFKAFIDPSAFYGADKESGELTFVDKLSRALGIVIDPAPSNELALRHDAVRQLLRHMIDGRRPGYLVSPNCRVTIAGFVAYYRYLKRDPRATVTLDPVPQKNHPHSDIHDSIQYGALGQRGRHIVMTKGSAAGRAGFNPKGFSDASVIKSNFDVFNA